MMDKEVLYRIERQIITYLYKSYVTHKENKIPLAPNCSICAIEDFNLFDMLRTGTQHIQYNVGDVFVISSSPRGKIPVMLYQKLLTGLCVGAVYWRLTCRFIGHYLQTWTIKFIPLHNLTSQERRNSPDWCFGLN